MRSGLFIAPSFLGVLVFFIAPFAVVIYYSMIDNPFSANFVFFKTKCNTSVLQGGVIK